MKKKKAEKEAIECVKMTEKARRAALYGKGKFAQMTWKEMPIEAGLLGREYREREKKTKKRARRDKWRERIAAIAITVKEEEEEENTSQRDFLGFQKACDATGRDLVSFHWSPGRVKITGNEKADKEVGKVSSLPPPGPSPDDPLPTLAYVRKNIKKKHKTLSQEWWSAHIASSYKE
ncbi:hypothetical protein GGR50DRAFT_698995 [Xylaria sp. CBS 124048]|nr:hypothetical protein GGR50DRAFT_698995 [Xylaria sp. CBS 124048]